MNFYTYTHAGSICHAKVYDILTMMRPAREACMLYMCVHIYAAENLQLRQCNTRMERISGKSTCDVVLKSFRPSIFFHFFL